MYAQVLLSCRCLSKGAGAITHLFSRDWHTTSVRVNYTDGLGSVSRLNDVDGTHQECPRPFEGILRVAENFAPKQMD